ncbi:MAG: hypothetical protein WDO19_20305 [Bacteroidota bacterium]
MNIGKDIGKNREVNFMTEGNKQVFYKDPDRFIRSFFRSYAEHTYRKGDINKAPVRYRL